MKIVAVLGLSVTLVALASIGCGGEGGGGGGGSGELSSGEVVFQVDFRGAEPTDKEVRRPPTMDVVAAPNGSDWWGFELRVKNAGNQPAHTPDVAVVCGSDSASQAEFLDDPGFIVGEPPYVRGSGAGGELDAGASNTGVVPLAIPQNAGECRFLVKMDEAVGEGGEPLEFPFEASSK